MVQITQLQIADFLKFNEALKEINQNFDLEIGYLYKYLTNNEEGLIYLNEDTKMIAFYYFLDNELHNTFGYFDDKDNLEIFFYDDFNILKQENLWILTDKNNVQQTINFFPIKPSFNNFNGQVVFVQYNPFTCNLVSMYFNHMYQDENSKISTFALHNPWKIILAKNKFPKFEKTYVLRDVSFTKTVEYNLLTLKQFGLVKFLQSSAFDLQKQDNLRNYYRVFFPWDGNYALNLFPLTKTYTEKEMMAKINSLGFSMQVNPTLIRIFNQDYEPLQNYQMLLNAIIESNNLKENKGIKLILEKDQH